MSVGSYAIQHHAPGSAEQLAELEHARRFDQDADWLSEVSGAGGNRLARTPGPSCLSHKTEHGSRFKQPFVHERPLDPPSLSFAAGGSLVQLKVPSRVNARRGVRGEITTFSHAAARNLTRKINAVDQGAVKADRIAFGTLTYPHHFVPPKTAKVHLKEFLRRLAREWGRVPLFWKLEPQKRGAPHFHLMIFTLSRDQLQRIAAWVPQAWFEIAGAGDRRNLQWHRGELGNGNKHCIEPIRSWNGAKSYTAKYLGKRFDGLNADEWEHPGRWWGTRYYEDLPVRVRRVDLASAKARLARRLMRRWYEKQPTGRFRVEDPDNGRVHRLYLRPPALKAYVELGFKVRPIHRRWTNSRGGITLYAPDTLARQILAWLGEAFDVHDDDGPPLDRPPDARADLRNTTAEPAPF